ncbi:hypothetical protein E4U43_002072 [Claviceps pusilla]|uniref:Uncharacterized protein n=1 Tax=Claviceps pusilla TaxID=123648 RepID=A0A9P7N6T7_9HYPO|nr:hypothetical protein E4U43_002072 [Claviceps pusilla]
MSGHEHSSLGVVSAGSVDWSKFAYVQYVTDSDYLCNSVMIFEALHRFGSRPDRLIMYPSTMMAANPSPDNSDDARLLTEARDEYNVRLRPVEVQYRSGSELAMPRAYWLFPEKQILSSQLMLVQPSATESGRVMNETNRAGSDDYDTEIVNTLYKDQALVLPHRPYDMLTAEFRTDQHAQYLGSDDEQWDPVAHLGEAKFVHFSDWPVPKPWIEMPDSVRNDMQPGCHRNRDGVESCVERDLWNGLYEDFAQRRETTGKMNDTRARTVGWVLRFMSVSKHWPTLKDPVWSSWQTDLQFRRNTLDLLNHWDDSPRFCGVAKSGTNEKRGTLASSGLRSVSMTYASRGVASRAWKWTPV